ncbi:MAG: hypothetical protein FH749_08460 [Firmicutes bacterium]|nr:hypothetical protein [Bacillota bacterium]
MSEMVNLYIQDVMAHLMVDDEMKRRIEKDLQAHIAELSEHDSIERVLERMGAPEDVAREFMDSIYEDKSEAIELVKERMRIEAAVQGYEFKSKSMLFGLPIIHVKHSGQVRRAAVAKGIIAIGDISIGVISIGGIALGGISIGGVSLGILALGGLALGGLALGGLAVGLAALGGVAIGQVAKGGVAIGHLAVGARAIGEHTLETDSDVITQETVTELYKAAFPQMQDWAIKLFTWFFRQ